jgi:hypothetical protein
MGSEVVEMCGCAWCGNLHPTQPMPYACPGCGRELGRSIGPDTTLGQLAELLADRHALTVHLGWAVDDAVTCTVMRSPLDSDDARDRVYVIARWTP